MKKKLGLWFCVILMIAGVGYHFMAPQVLVNNLSDRNYQQINFTLPSNSLTFSPVHANSRQTIYVKPQQSAGTITYELVAENGDKVAQGQLTYHNVDDAFGQLGSKLTLTIDPEYRITLTSNIAEH
ncbi:hypothetical protein [Shewanella waksmanii]|uniref:hypothetical protein n=1 Tax=Shewanella waksmanii TaxID=213783 RepID=UPI0004B0B0D4|nr:hypothetical protein [Shewanella waksmanii]